MNRDHDQVENSCIKRYEPLADMPISQDSRENAQEMPRLNMSAKQRSRKQILS